MPAPIVRGLITVALVVWIVCRILLVAASLITGGPGDIRPTLTLPQIVFIGGVATVVLLLEARRRGELLFLRNLGLSPVHVAFGVVAPLVLGEFLLRAWLGR